MTPIMKPILFNTEMVRANQRGDKTATRRICHIKINKGEEVSHRKCISVEYPKRNVDGLCANFYDEQGYYCGAAKPTYQPGDILYVRETFFESNFGLQYRADWPNGDSLYMHYDEKWRPSIHMPREAARIFLRVLDVQAERLQEITPEQCIAEGVEQAALDEVGGEFVRGMFSDIWDSTVKPADAALYGWAANPWVWVYKYEQISKEECHESP